MLSLAPEVNTNSYGVPPTSRASSLRAARMASAEASPRGYRLDGLPQRSRNQGSIASSTSCATRVVALLSR